MSHNYENISSFYKALAHPTRIQILNIIKNYDEICVCNIYEELNLEQSNVSQHLKILKTNGLLNTRREGLKIMYSLKDSEIITLMTIANAIITRQLEEQLSSINHTGG